MLVGGWDVYNVRVQPPQLPQSSHCATQMQTYIYNNIVFQQLVWHVQYIYIYIEIFVIIVCKNSTYSNSQTLMICSTVMSSGQLKSYNHINWQTECLNHMIKYLFIILYMLLQSVANTWPWPKTCRELGRSTRMVWGCGWSCFWSVRIRILIYITYIYINN